MSRRTPEVVGFGKMAAETEITRMSQQSHLPTGCEAGTHVHQSLYVTTGGVPIMEISILIQSTIPGRLQV